ncbi:hypothetical protein V8D89_001092 [Ganoderma adspersum]
MELPTDIVWEKFTSSNGTEYEVGYPAQGETTDPDAQAKTGGRVVRASGPAFSTPVNWPVAHAGGWGEWKDTTPEVNRVARITKYNLYKYGGGDTNWNYMLQFANEDTYHYYFRDQEGDTYSVNTFRNGEHYLRYNSDQPNIVNVEGN